MGWHIDSSQKPSVRHFTSDALLYWQKFWIKDREIGTDLLKQFIEDLTDDIQTLGKLKDDETNQSKNNEMRDSLNHILAMMQVFNTVLSCLRNQSNPKTTLDKEGLNWFDTILQCLFLITGEKEAEQKDKKQHPCHSKNSQFEEDIFVTGQQAIMLLLEMCQMPIRDATDSTVKPLYLEKKSELSQLLKYFLSHFLSFSRQGQICTLRYTLHMLDLAADCGTQGQNQEEKIVQFLINARIIEKAAFSTQKQVIHSVLVLNMILHHKIVIKHMAAIILYHLVFNHRYKKKQQV